MADMKKVQVGNKNTKMEFAVPQPYDEGHTLTAIEAKQLNQCFAENICNNMRAKVKATIEGAEDAMDEATLNADFKEYAAEYAFTEASAGSSRATMTPIEKAARKIARDLVVYQLKQPSDEHPKGRKVSDVHKDDFAAEVARFAETEKVQKLAAKRVKEMDAITADLLSD